MRARNELDRLTTAGRPLLAAAESLVDATEEDRILVRIVASARPVPAPARRRHAALVLVGVAVIAAATVVASLEIGRSSPASPTARDRHHLALSGSKIKLAGYRFKTPAGFKASAGACALPAADGQPQTVLSRFGAAASADGGCVEAFLLSPGSPTASPATPAGAAPVGVGSYQGYYVSLGQSGANLYVELPAQGEAPTYLVLFAQGLTEDQLVAVAVSGLPTGSDSSNRVIR